MSRKRYRRAPRFTWGRWVAGAVASVVVIAFLITYFTMMTRLSAQNKVIAGVDADIRELNARVDNLNLCLNQYHNLERITSRAQELGMYVPTQSEIRVVYLPGIVGDTSAQSVENVGAEESMN